MIEEGMELRSRKGNRRHGYWRLHMGIVWVVAIFLSWIHGVSVEA